MSIMWKQQHPLGDKKVLESYHPSSDKVSHPRPHCGNLHETLVPDAHVFCHHVGPARKEAREEKGQKKCILMRAREGVQRSSGRKDKKSPERRAGGSVEAGRENAPMLSIIMLAVRVDQYQSNPGKNNERWLYLHQSPEDCKQFTPAQ